MSKHRRMCVYAKYNNDAVETDDAIEENDEEDDGAVENNDAEQFYFGESSITKLFCSVYICVVVIFERDIYTTFYVHSLYVK